MVFRPTVLLSSTQSYPPRRRRFVNDHAVGLDRGLELIAAGDAPGAEAWWRRHLTEANRYLLAIPGGDDPLDLLD